MREPQHECRGARARGEQGGARLNFLIVAALVALAGYAAYNYVPVAYNAFLYRDFMQETVDKAAFPPGQSLGWVESQLRAKAEEFGLPDDTAYTVQNQDNHVVARVRWSRPIPMPGFIYEYDFDHTARSNGFINP
ncbi:MAG TPA: hypothetical protein VN228_09490 [Pyrinomonadaceae bacterium]|nr:hypothetical protein [Pyrinomonadaceae bacterium]